MLSVRRIRTGEYQQYKKIRLESLKESPGAYGSTYESSMKRSEQSWVEQADGGSKGSDQAIFFALWNGQPAGLATLYRLESHREVGELNQVWVLPKIRRQGVAKVLMDVIIDWAAKNNFKAVTAGIMSGNVSAMKFYQAYGFVPETGILLNCPGDAAVLIKDLE